jgi:LCP family protein required for cell wall assembly
MREPRGGPVWLVVGVDSRNGLSGDEFGVVQGARADAIHLVQVGSTSVHTLAIPRDLLVQPMHYPRQRLSGLMSYEASMLVIALRHELGVSVNHYVQLDMLSFTRVIDSVGGIQLSLSAPSRDAVTGLQLTQGDQILTGNEALAFVRSRQYEEKHDGVWHAVGADDLGRLDRQTIMLRALTEKFQDASKSALLRAAASAEKGISVDQRTTGTDIEDLAKGVLSLQWESAVLPTSRRYSEIETRSPFPPPHRGGAAMLVKNEPEATLALRGFRNE